jgi:hypothetical protein
MKKVILGGVVALALLPFVSYATVINSLNGVSANAEFLATTSDATSMHLKITNNNSDTHTFQWNGVPWSVAKGGTGTTTFSNGSVLFFSSSIFSQDNANFFWNTSTKSLGIGNSSPQHKLDVTGAIYSRLVTVSPSSNVTVNWNSGNVQTLTLNSNTSLSFSNAQAGGEYKLILNQDSAGNRTVTWPASVKWPGGTAPTLTSTTGAIDMVDFTFTGSTYLGTYNLDFQTPSSTNPLANSLVSYWKFDADNSNDSAGSNNGTDTDISYSSANGKINDGAGFNGSTSYITQGANNFPTGSAARTFNMWVKLNNQPISGHLGTFLMYGNAANENMQSVGVYNNSGSYYIAYNGYGDDYNELYTLSTSTYYMITATFDGTTAKLYVNGSQLGTGSNQSSWNTSASTNYYLGSQGGSDYMLDGSLDEVAVWSRVLSGSEISQLYNSGNGNQYPF